MFHHLFPAKAQKYTCLYFNNFVIYIILNAEISNKKSRLALQYAHDSYDEVEKVISKPKNKKACGIDNISNEVLKNKNISICLWSHFSKCFEFSCIPSSWSKAIINPISKNKHICISYL